MPCYAVFEPTASVHTCALNGMTDLSSIADCQAALDYNNPLHTGSDGANCSTGYNCVVDPLHWANGRHNYGLNCVDSSAFTCGDSATSTGPGPASDCDGGSRTWNCVGTQDIKYYLTGCRSDFGHSKCCAAGSSCAVLTWSTCVCYVGL